MNVVLSSHPVGPFGSTLTRVGERPVTRMSPTMIGSAVLARTASARVRAIALQASDAMPKKLICQLSVAKFLKNESENRV
jgi:hypothetical protein